MKFDTPGVVVQAVVAIAEGARRVARGHALGFGGGIAMGFATMGRFGFEGRWDYAAIGSVTNLAARLCAEAHDGQILVSQPVPAYNVVTVKAAPAAPARP